MCIMNSKQLQRLFSKNFSTFRQYQGCFYFNELLEILIQHKQTARGLYISNTAQEEETGKHWILVYFDEKKCVFFDSLAHSADHYSVAFAKLLPNTYESINVAVQSAESDLCGFFCLYVGIMLCCGKNLSVIMSSFNQTSNKQSNFEYNDAFVIEFVSLLPY